MIYNTEEDILEIRKWCDGHELLKCHNYSYQYFDCNETRLKINYFDIDIWEGVYFILYFNEEFFLTDSTRYRESDSTDYYPTFLLSDVLMEIRNEKLEFLLKQI